MKINVFCFRAAKTLLSLLLITFIGLTAHAKRVVKIFDVKRSFALNKGQKTYKDYYINGGKEFGLKPGMLINVQRRMTLYDSFQNRSPGDLLITVGKIKIIHVQSGISVAREYSLDKKHNKPLLDYNYIMVGDNLDLNSAKMDRGRSRKSASNNPFKVKKIQSIEKSKINRVSFSSEVSAEPLNISIN